MIYNHLSPWNWIRTKRFINHCLLSSDCREIRWLDTMWNQKSVQKFFPEAAQQHCQFLLKHLEHEEWGCIFLFHCCLQVFSSLWAWNINGCVLSCSQEVDLHASVCPQRDSPTFHHHPNRTFFFLFFIKVPINFHTFVTLRASVDVLDVSRWQAKRIDYSSPVIKQFLEVGNE